jgi:hypothetical protein
LTRSENKFLDALSAPKLCNTADDVILSILKYGLTILGVNKIPSEIEFALLIRSVKENHGQITNKEFRLAFDMAANLELEFNSNTYQNFSVLYLNELMKAYKSWSSKVYNVAPMKPTYSHYVINRMSVNETRRQIQLGLVQFRLGLLSQKAYIPYEWYRQLCDDGYIEFDAGASLVHNKKFDELTEEDSLKLKRSQQYVWDLFQAAGSDDLYIEI